MTQPKSAVKFAVSDVDTSEQLSTDPDQTTNRSSIKKVRIVSAKSKGSPKKSNLAMNYRHSLIPIRGTVVKPDVSIVEGAYDQDLSLVDCMRFGGDDEP